MLQGRPLAPLILMRLHNVTFRGALLLGEVLVSLSWQVQYLVKFQCDFPWRVQYLVLVPCHFLKFQCHLPWPEYLGMVQYDAFSGGDEGDVWASFQQELNLAEQYGLHMDPSKCTLYLWRAINSAEMYLDFRHLGLKLLRSLIAKERPYSNPFTNKKLMISEDYANVYSNSPCPYSPLPHAPRRNV